VDEFSGLQSLENACGFGGGDCDFAGVKLWIFEKVCNMSPNKIV
jgi:hypothetical protein